MTVVRRAFSVAVFARRPTGELLLIKHRRLGTWLPVGGEVEAGESPLEAAQRELMEETGLRGVFTSLPDAVDGTPPGLVGYEEHPAGSKGTHLNFCFVADVDGEPRAHEEWSEHRWVASAVGVECPKNVAQLIEQIVAGQGRLECEALARAWLRLFNAKDLDGLLALYADDAVHTSPKLRDKRPETMGLVRGKAALHAWWADAFVRLPGLVYEEIAVTASAERVFLEYVRKAPGETDLVVAELFIVRRGRIAQSAVFHG